MTVKQIGNTEDKCKFSPVFRFVGKKGLALARPFPLQQHFIGHNSFIDCSESDHTNIMASVNTAPSLLEPGLWRSDPSLERYQVKVLVVL